MSRSTALAGRIGQLTGLTVREARVVGAQHGYQHLMLTLPGGRRAFAKAVPAPDPGAVPGRSAVPDQGAVPARDAAGSGAVAALSRAKPSSTP